MAKNKYSSDKNLKYTSFFLKELLTLEEHPQLENEESEPLNSPLKGHESSRRNLICAQKNWNLGWDENDPTGMFVRARSIMTIGNAFNDF